MEMFQPAGELGKNRCRSSSMAMIYDVEGIVIWTLQSISIYSIRSHYFEYTKYINNVDAGKCNIGGISLC